MPFFIRTFFPKYLNTSLFIENYNSDFRSDSNRKIQWLMKATKVPTEGSSEVAPQHSANVL